MPEPYETRPRVHMSQSEEPGGRTNNVRRGDSGRQAFVSYLHRIGHLKDGMTDEEWDKALKTAVYHDDIGGRVVTFDGLGLSDPERGGDDPQRVIDEEEDLEHEARSLMTDFRPAA